MAQKPPDLDENLQPVTTKPPDLDDTGKPEPGLLSKAWQYLNKKPDTAQSVNQNLQGGLLDPNLSIADKVNLFLNGPKQTQSGTPIATGMDFSIIPEAEHKPDESWPMWGVRAIHNNLIQPLGSPAGMLGAASIGENPVVTRLNRLIESDKGNIGEIGKQIANPQPSIMQQPSIMKDVGNLANKDKKFNLNLGLPINDTPGGTGRPPSLQNLDELPVKPAPLPNAAMGGPPKPPVNLSELSKLPEGPNKYQQIVDFTREMRASIDFSAPLRQGLPLISRTEWWTSLDDMVRAFGSEKAYKVINDGIRNSPIFKKTITATGEEGPSWAEKMGLYLSDSVNVKEEAYASKWAAKLPGIRRSERAYTTFLNKLRADTFESIINTSKALGEDPEKNQHVAKAIADFVNTSTGRGNLIKNEHAAWVLNNTLFSPKLMESRLQMMNPAYYINQPKSIRLQKLKALITLGGTGTLMAELAKMGGAEVENDPASSDFRKIKIGNVRLDPYGGQQQYLVALNRLAPAMEGLPTGRYKSSTNGKSYNLSNPPFAGLNRMDVGENFLTNKLNPVLGVAHDLLRQSKKRPFQVSQEAAQIFVPMFIQDVYDLYQSDIDPLAKVGIGALSAFGMGQQVYGGRTPN